MQYQFNNAQNPYYFINPVTPGALGGIAGDTISGHDVGLKVDSFALVGTQVHRRNVWIAQDPNNYRFDAQLEDPSDRRILLNRFTVEGAYMPRKLSTTQAQNWFIQQDNPNPILLFNCGQIPNVGVIGTPIGASNIYTDIADSTYQATTTDPEAYVWMLEKQAYEEFMALPTNLQTATMQTFLQSKQNSDIEIFYQLKKGLENLFEKDPVRAERLKLLNEFMDNWATKKQAANGDPILEDASIGEWNKEYMTITKEMQTEAQQKAADLLQLNESLPDNIESFGWSGKARNNKARPYVFYEKVVNALYLSKIIANTPQYTPKEGAILKKIALMCPLEAGEAPMKARGIYQHFVDPTPLPDSDCSKVPMLIRRKSVDLVQFKIYPNPTNGFLYMQSEVDCPLTWQVYSTSGVLVRSGNMNGQMDILDTRDLPNGLYFIKVSENGQLRTTVKFVVMK